MCTNGDQETPLLTGKNTSVAVKRRVSSYCSLAMRLAFLRSVEILSDAITIMQVTPILQMINLKEDPDSNFRISRSKPDTILSMKIRYHSSTFKSVFYTHPLPVS